MNRLTRVLLLAMLAIMAVAIYSCSTLGLGDNKTSSVVSSVFNTDLIAGDGAGNGPGNGTDAGDISFSDDGSELTISVDMDDANNWSAGNFHIYIGEGIPTNPNNGKPTVAPGQFPYNAGDGTWTVPGDQWTGTFDISQFEGPLTIAVHGEGINTPDAGTSLFEVNCTDPFAEFGLYAGANDTLVGNVVLSMSGTDVLVTVTMIAPYLLNEAHMFLEESPAIPPFAPGQWEYNSGPQNGVTSYTFTVPMSDLGITPPDAFLKDLTMAFHVALTDANGGNAQSATAWGGDLGCRTPLAKDKNGGLHPWKSYTTCITMECDGFTEIIETGEGTEETLWAANPGDNYFEGWFPNNGFNRWGWFIYYQPQP